MKIIKAVKAVKAVLVLCSLNGLAGIASANTNVEDVLTPSLTVGTDLYSDRDDLKINTGSVEYRKGHDIFDYHHEQEPEKVLLWSVKASRSSIDQNGAANLEDYRRYDVSGTLAQKFNEQVSAEVALGDVQVKNKNTHEDNHLTRYGVKAKVNLNEKLVLHAKHERNYLFGQGIVEGDNGELLHGDTSSLELYWRPEEKWRVEGQLGRQRISDGNMSQRASASLLYGISPSWPWVWAGVTAETLNYDEAKNSYWTPNKYQSYGLVADSSFAINERINMSLGAAINRNKENNNPTGTGYSISAGADWQVGENITLKAKGYLLESTQESSVWQQDQINVSINIKTY